MQSKTLSKIGTFLDALEKIEQGLDSPLKKYASSKEKKKKGKRKKSPQKS